MMNSIMVKNATVSYGKNTILRNINVHFLDGKITALIGQNGCGKSTLLRTMNKLIPMDSGNITICNEDIMRMKRKDLAKKMSFLEQSVSAPDGMTLFQLVKLGRYCHQNILQQWTDTDECITRESMKRTGVWNIRDKSLSDVSGGQLQRTWFAMTLSQNASILLLDEPISHLDLTYQLECLDLLAEINKEHKKTIVMVLHDVNLAARYADEIVVMRSDGLIYDQGSPHQVMTKTMFSDIFHISCHIISNPDCGTPIFVPQNRI